MLALLTRPWWWRRSAVVASRQALNAAIYRDQLLELEHDRADGELPEADYEQARAELQRRLIEDAAEADAAIPTASRTLPTAIALLVALPLAAAALYAWLGNPAGLDRMAQGNFSRADIDRMVGTLAAKLEKEPDNLQGWAMLARSYKALHRPEDAVRAFEKAGAAVQQDPQLLADYADLLASGAGGDFTGKPEQLITRALMLDPDNMQALWLAGTAAFNRSDFAAAIQHWERAVKQLPPESEDAKLLSGAVNEAREKQRASKSSSTKAR
jgi:cytochrome c-type biogenesis protein CcmH